MVVGRGVRLENTFKVLVLVLVLTKRMKNIERFWFWFLGWRTLNLTALILVLTKRLENIERFWLWRALLVPRL